MTEIPEENPHIWLYTEENQGKSFVSSVLYCAVISRTKPYWSVRVKVDRAVMGTTNYSPMAM